jgi:hypothetical protein
MRAKHIGEVLYAKMKDEFDTVVDRMQIALALRFGFQKSKRTQTSTVAIPDMKT